MLMQIYRSLDEVVEAGTIASDSIVNADCLEAMKFIPDKSIDCIICDLPYGVTACKWDELIPFEPLWEQYKRIVKPNGAIVLFGSQPFTSALVMSNPKWFKYEWVWEKEQGVGFQLAKYRPLLKNESCLVFSKGTPKYYPQKTPLIKPKIVKRNINSNGMSKTSPIKYSEKRISIYTFKTPDNFLKFNRERGLHSTQKPVKLIEYLAKTYTLENEIIVDNTAGSGTLAIACINTNRRYICIEKDPEYFDVMKYRIENHDPNALATPKKARKPKAIPEGQLRLFG